MPLIPIDTFFQLPILMVYNIQSFVCILQQNQHLLISQSALLISRMSTRLPVLKVISSVQVDWSSGKTLTMNLLTKHTSISIREHPIWLVSYLKIIIMSFSGE